MTGTIVVALDDAARPGDGAGAATLSAIRRLNLDHVRLVTWWGDATGLADRWSGADLVILIDDAAATGPVARVRRRSLHHPSTVGQAVPSAHGRLVRDAVNLSAAFGRLPPTVLMYIVDTCSPGAGPAIHALAVEIGAEVVGHRPPGQLSPSHPLRGPRGSG